MNSCLKSTCPKKLKTFSENIPCRCNDRGKLTADAVFASFEQKLETLQNPKRERRFVFSAGNYFCFLEKSSRVETF